MKRLFATLAILLLTGSIFAQGQMPMPPLH